MVRWLAGWVSWRNESFARRGSAENWEGERRGDVARGIAGQRKRSCTTNLDSGDSSDYGTTAAAN